MRATLLALLRSRLGVALMLSLVVLLVVSAFRLFGAAPTPPTQAGPGYTVSPTLNTHEPDDGVATPPPAQLPSIAPGAAAPVQVAAAFAANWVRGSRSTSAWVDALRPYCTEHLLEQLSGVDPASVPARKVTGEPSLIPRAFTYAEVTVPLDAGVLKLRLLGPDGHWRVDGVDWVLS